MAGRVAGWEESWRLKLISAEVEVEAELGKNCCPLMSLPVDRMNGD